jgi:SAM-dependent methyltransferase
MSFYQRVLGHPIIFNRLRPFFVGGIDWTVLYQELDAGADSVVLDVGCGMGVAHQYLKGFREYHGFDTDSVAIEEARRNASGPNISYQCRLLTGADLHRIQPTRIILSGLLHHLSDTSALNLLQMCAGAPSVERIATADSVYLPGQHVSNFLAFFDRGKFVRWTEGFLELVQQADLRIIRHQIVRSHPTKGRALYLVMTLSPRDTLASK